jgi:hypothetical protein
MFATLTSFRSSSPRPRPKIRTPPAEVVAEIMDLVTSGSKNPAPSVTCPRTTRTVPAESSTPHPNTEAKARAAIKSRALLRASRLLLGHQEYRPNRKGDVQRQAPPDGEVLKLPSRRSQPHAPCG